MTCLGCCQISHLSIYSSQACSDKPCSPAELEELSPRLLLRQLTGRGMAISIFWAGDKNRCLHLWEALATFCELLIQLRVHIFSEKKHADAMTQLRQ